MVNNNIDIKRCNIIAQNISLGYIKIEDIPNDLSQKEKELIFKLIGIKDIITNNSTSNNSELISQTM